MTSARCTARRVGDSGRRGVTDAAGAAPPCRAGGRVHFIIAVADTQGRPVADLRRDEVLMSENGVVHEIVKVEPYTVRVETHHRRR